MKLVRDVSLVEGTQDVLSRRMLVIWPRPELLAEIVAADPAAEDLLELEAQANSESRPCCLVRDGGHTEIPEGTPTCIAILGGDYPDWTLY